MRIPWSAPGCRTGNGGKLSNSWFDWLQLSFSPFPVRHPSADHGSDILVQRWPKKCILGCVISPLRQQAESRNLGQTFLANSLLESLSWTFWTKTRTSQVQADHIYRQQKQGHFLGPSFSLCLWSVTLSFIFPIRPRVRHRRWRHSHTVQKTNIRRIFYKIFLNLRNFTAILN